MGDWNRLRRLELLLWLLAWTLLGGTVVWAEEEHPDWKAVIDQLTQEVRRMPDAEPARQQLAVAHNNYAVDLASRGEWDLATSHLRQAIELDGTGGQFRRNLASVHLSRAYQEYADRHLDRARAAIQEALAADPNLTNAYALLGELEYDAQHLKEAKAAWERALQLNPGQSELAERLKQLNQEIPVESKFDRISEASFDLRYEEQLERPMGFDIRSFLLEARRVVGSDFALWPQQKLVVLLYSARSFKALRRQTPDWLAGQYDGKIRVPLPDDELDLETVKQILFHEYTHAVVHEATRGRCPVWLNEGLAEYEGARYGRRRLNQLAEAAAGNRLVPWEQLDHYFSMTLPVEQAALGYQQSHSIVQYLADRYGFWRIRRLLVALGSGTSLDQALEQEFHIKLQRLQANWRSWLPEFLQRSS